MGLIRITKIFPTYDGNQAFTAVYVDANGKATHGVLNNGKFEHASYLTVRCDSSLPFEPEVGQLWLINGEYIQTRVDYGTAKMQVHQYMHPELQIQMPKTDEAFIQFIASSPDFKGIGETTMRKLFAKVHNARELLLGHDVEALQNYLTPERLKILLKGLKKYENMSSKREMASLGIPLIIQMRLIRIHKKEAIEQIKQNPYVLITFGMSFIKVDAIARSDRFGIQIDDKRRLAGAVEDVLINIFSHSVDTYTNLSRVKSALSSRLGLKFDLIDKALTLGSNGRSYIIHDQKIFLTSKLMSEIVISKRFLKLASRPKDTWTNKHENALKAKLLELDYYLTPEQVSAVKTSVTSHISCIVGGAGTGKTTVIRTIFRVMNGMGYQIIPLVLSGRAARRMHESTGFITSTIAQLLCGPPENYECKKILVIFESGMVDVQSMFKLILHHHPSIRILMVGDPQQLSSIGAGNLLEDTINSGAIPVSKLSVLKLQGEKNSLQTYSLSIAKGEIPETLSKTGVEFIESSEIASDVVRQLKVTHGEKIAIAPTKSLVKEINRLAQAELNPYGQALIFNMFGLKYKTEFRVGDPVIFTENNYKEGIQNGSMGEFIRAEGDFGVVCLEDGTEKKLTKSLYESMRLSYAITLDKAQGSKFDSVIIALKNIVGLTDRKWLYTSISRALKNLYLVGQREGFAKMIVKKNDRKTQLQQLLKEPLLCGSLSRVSDCQNQAAES